MAPASAFGFESGSILALIMVMRERDTASEPATSSVSGQPFLRMQACRRPC
jgi:hypothetical protein